MTGLIVKNESWKCEILLNLTYSTRREFCMKNFYAWVTDGLGCWFKLICRNHFSLSPILSSLPTLYHTEKGANDPHCKNMIRFVSYLLKIQGFLLALQLSPTSKTDAAIWLKYSWKWQKKTKQTVNDTSHACRNHKN